MDWGMMTCHKTIASDGTMVQGRLGGEPLRAGAFFLTVSFHFLAVLFELPTSTSTWPAIQLTYSHSTTLPN